MVHALVRAVVLVTARSYTQAMQLPHAAVRNQLAPHLQIKRLQGGAKSSRRQLHPIFEALLARPGWKLWANMLDGSGSRCDVASKYFVPRHRCDRLLAVFSCTDVFEEVRVSRKGRPGMSYAVYLRAPLLSDAGFVWKRRRML